MNDKLLLTPGPVRVPDEALEVMRRPLIHHRTKTFTEVFRRAARGLQWVFQTSQPVLMLTSSGTGAFESVFLNFTRRGDRVVVIGGGKFGERWGEMGDALGLEVIRMPVEWGKCADPRALEALLVKYPDVSMVTLSHSETSMGVLHPLKELLDVVREHSNALCAVDGITSVGVHPVPMDEWGIDVMVSGSQKAFAVPPGLSFVAASERAWERAEQSDHARYYFDLRREHKKQEGAGQTAFTPAISVVLALDASLELMQREGLEAIWSRHATHSRAVRAAVTAMGCEPFAEVPAHCVTSIRMPEGVSAPRIREVMRDEYGVLMAGCYEHLKSSVLRFGHLGVVGRSEVLAGVSALEMALGQCGAQVVSGAGVQVAQKVYAESEQ